MKNCKIKSPSRISYLKKLKCKGEVKANTWKQETIGKLIYVPF